MNLKRNSIVLTLVMCADALVLGFIICTLIVLCTGCLAPHKVVRELKDDPASFNLEVRSVYGTLRLTRSAPRTDSAPHVITPEGGITVTGLYPVATNTATWTFPNE